MDFISTLAPGQRLGSYTIVRPIGEGGMGIVYEARSDQGARVALKVLSDWLASEIGRRRFVREIEAIAQLAHPNIVAIYDYGQTDDGTLYYAMEHLDGVDLGYLVKTDGAQPAPRVARILYQIAGALGDAHEKGLVHRDIKPANILLCESAGAPDVAKLVDFGLVMPMTRTNRLTLEGHVLGTPRYVAPEMLRANGVLSPAMDLYALGLVAYYLLAGRHTFDGEGTADILKKQRDDVPPSLVTLGVASDLASVIAWCLEKSPDARPKSAHTLREALARCADMSRWSEAEAAAWWVRWRAEHAGEPISVRPPDREERSGDERSRG